MDTASGDYTYDVNSSVAVRGEAPYRKFVPIWVEKVMKALKGSYGSVEEIGFHWNDHYGPWKGLATKYRPAYAGGTHL